MSQENAVYKKFEELLRDGKEDEILNLLKNIAKDNRVFMTNKPNYFIVQDEQSCYYLSLHYENGEMLDFRICPQGAEVISSRKSVQRPSKKKCQAQLTDKIVTKISTRLEKKIQDMLNPFTVQIEELKKKYVEIVEKLDALQEEKNKGYGVIEEKKEAKRGGRKTAIEILEEQGVVFEPELKLKNKDAYFRRLEKDGAKVINLENERIAMSQEFYKKFLEKLKEIRTADTEEVISRLDQKQAKLFRKLADNAILFFNSEKKEWELIIK